MDKLSAEKQDSIKVQPSKSISEDRRVKITIGYSLQGKDGVSLRDEANMDMAAARRGRNESKRGRSRSRSRSKGRKRPKHLIERVVSVPISSPSNSSLACTSINGPYISITHSKAVSIDITDKNGAQFKLVSQGSVPSAAAEEGFMMRLQKRIAKFFEQ